MGIDIANLMQHVQDYFLHAFQNAGAAAPMSTFLAFELLGGIPITPDMFKLKSDDPNYSEGLAGEQFSRLTNTIPAIDADSFQHTGKTIDDFYKLLITGAQQTMSGSAENTLFDGLKRQALKKMDDMSSGSYLLGPSNQFYPAFATPADWYDPSIEANWTQYTFGAGTSDASENTRPAPPVPPVVRVDPVRRPWTWRVVSEQARPALGNPSVLRQLSMSEATSQFRGRSEQSGPEHLNNVGGATRRQGSPHSSATLQKDVSPILAPISTLPRTALTDSHASTLTINPSILASILIRQPAVEAAKVAMLVEAASSKPVISQNLTISLKYCLVTISRPWLSLAFLTMPNWFIPGYTAGSFSTGEATNNAGVFPTLPLAFILIKDLKIEADWSGNDASDAQQAAALGPFALFGREIDHVSGTLTLNSMQIIGWICQVMPLLPPLNTPA